jgi:hypothetical protein
MHLAQPSLVFSLVPLLLLLGGGLKDSRTLRSGRSFQTCEIVAPWHPCAAACCESNRVLDSCGVTRHPKSETCPRTRVMLEPEVTRPSARTPPMVDPTCKSCHFCSVPLLPSCHRKFKKKITHTVTLYYVSLSTTPPAAFLSTATAVCLPCEAALSDCYCRLHHEHHVRPIAEGCIAARLLPSSSTATAPPRSCCAVLRPSGCHVLLKAHVRCKLCFECFRCFRDMLQMFQIDVAKVD